MDAVIMKLKFFIQLAEVDPVGMDQGQEDQLLSMARDGDLIRVLKDDIMELELGESSAQEG